jgi:L-lactate dehydrogenase complex protein LldF
VYPGPIGAILTPQLVGIENASSLPYASSLCGACYEVCPVKIDIPRVLLHLRSLAPKPRAERTIMRAAAWVFRSPRRFALAQRLGRRVPFPRAWTRTRDVKPFPKETFRDWWIRERGA